MAHEWKLQDAKSRFSELFERVMVEGVQIVTRHGTKKVAIIPLEEYERLTRPKSSLSEFFLSSPLAGSELVIKRVEDLPRDIEIEP